MQPTTKTELKAYLSALYFALEREQTSEPDVVEELKTEIQKLKSRCEQCDVEIPKFSEAIIWWFGKCEKQI